MDFVVKKVRLFVLILLGIVLVLFVKNEYSNLLLKKTTYGMPALIDKGEIDNLFLGSSMFRQGLDITVLEESLEDVYILSYNGNQPILEYYELSYLIDNGLIIHNLYVDMYAYSAVSEPSISDEKLFLETNIAMKAKLWHSMSDKSLKKWWDMFVSANNDQLSIWPLNSRLVNPMFYKGGTLNETAGMSTDEYNSLVELEIETHIDDLQKNAIRKIVDLCNSNNINLCFVDTPKSKVINEYDEYNNVMEEYEDILTEYSTEYIRQNKDYVFDTNDSDMYMDSVHLSSKGRKDFTGKLLNIIVTE